MIFRKSKMVNVSENLKNDRKLCCWNTELMTKKAYSFKSWIQVYHINLTLTPITLNKLTRIIIETILRYKNQDFVNFFNQWHWILLGKLQMCVIIFKISWLFFSKIEYYIFATQQFHPEKYIQEKF